MELVYLFFILLLVFQLFLYFVWYAISFIGLIFAPFSKFHSKPICRIGISLRGCPREHKAVVPYVISPISVKLFQFKRSTQKNKLISVLVISGGR